MEEGASTGMLVCLANQHIPPTQHDLLEHGSTGVNAHAMHSALLSFAISSNPLQGM